MSAPQNKPAVDPSAEELQVEPDNPPWKLLVVVLAGLAVFLLVSGVGLNQFFKSTTRALVLERSLSRVSPDLLEIQARDSELLTTYGLEDKDKQVYRVPIEQAMEMVLADHALVNKVAPQPPALAAPVDGDPAAAPTTEGQAQDAAAPASDDTDNKPAVAGVESPDKSSESKKKIEDAPEAGTKEAM